MLMLTFGNGFILKFVSRCTGHPLAVWVYRNRYKHGPVIGFNKNVFSESHPIIPGFNRDELQNPVVSITFQHPSLGLTFDSFFKSTMPASIHKSGKILNDITGNFHIYGHGIFIETALTILNC